MEKIDENDVRFEFHKENEDSKVYKVWRVGITYWGEHLFSVDKKTIYNLFADYPHNFTREAKELFDKEYPFWKNFFSARDQRTIEDYEKEHK